jgi:gamma-glutamyltranspeptidase/glutathione hydrolase
MLNHVVQRLAPLLALATLGLPLTATQAAAPLAAESSEGMVVSAQHLATDVGATILRNGGNAIDAAVAMGYALAVTHPCCGNIGGGGFMVIHLADGKNTFINFRERAPAAATANMYLDAQGNAIADKALMATSPWAYLEPFWGWKPRGKNTALCRARRCCAPPSIWPRKDSR